MKIRIQKKNNRHIFWMLFALLITLIFVRYVLRISFPWVVFLGVVAAIALVGDRDEIIAMCLCCIPLYSSLQYIYALAICMFFYVVKFHDDIRINCWIVPILLMLLWEWLHCFDRYSSVMGAVRALTPLIFCTMLMFCRKDRIHYPFAIRTLAICVSLMCVIVLSKLLVESRFNIAKAFTNMQRLGMTAENMEATGAEFNPNYLGFLCIICSTGLLQLRMSNQKQKNDMAIVVFLLVCGLLTMSRTFLLCLALMIVLLVLAYGINFRKMLKMLGSVAGVGLVVMVVLLVFFPETAENWAARFQVADITSGRMVLMELYHERIFSSPRIYLYGIGMQSVTQKVEHLFGTRKILGTVVPHNAIQEMIFCWGIPGLILFIYFILALIASAKRKNPGMKLINYVPLLLLLVKIQAGQLISTPPNMLIIAVTYLSMCHGFHNKETAQSSGGSGIREKRKDLPNDAI